jgi:His/Glu/Gln/Arg/opine family amino acid ABC transporter permease subunit
MSALNAYLGSLIDGAGVTLGVAFGSLALALVLGLGGAAAKLSRSPGWRSAAVAYTTVVRGVPDLLIMLLVFYGGQMALNAALEALGSSHFIDVNPFFAGVLTIGFIFGAYLTETFRGAFLAVPPGQAEAAAAFGMGRAQALARVVGPQMLRQALAPLSNNWLVLLKSTAIVSVIGLTDLMQRASLAAGSTREPFLFYGAAAVMYLALTTLSEWFFAHLQQRLSIGSRRANP